MFAVGIGSKKLLASYITHHKLQYKIDANNKNKMCNTARTNGRKSAVTLTGVELKPMNDEIVQWYISSVNSGKFRMDIMRELKLKFGFGRKKYDQLVLKYGIGQRNPQTGELNPMYGKPSPLQSGNGIKSHIIVNGITIFCRSFLELKIYIFLKNAGVRFELAKHHIKYLDDTGSPRTYNPDIVLIDYDTICEVKPKSLINVDINKLKFESAIKYCSKWGL